jgi:asparagine synthase (glutamine-hydrolysing)
MCGIAGILTGQGPVDPGRLERMSRVLAHRGPDDQGVWVDPEVGLGLVHRRLSILDLSERGHQPMQRGSAVLVFNGEIYNYRELREELQSLGHQFSSDTDSEVVLEAWLEWGAECVSRFNGMWGFALWDRQKRRLFCSRDRFGVKPFYYAFKEGEFRFASEPKALLADDPSLRRMRPDTLMRFLAEGLVDDEGEATFYPEIHRLPPAHSLTLEDGRLRVWRFWTLKAEPALEAALAQARDSLAGAPGLNELTRTDLAFEPSDAAAVFGTPPVQRIDEAAEAFRDLLVDAVRLRLRSDVPVGTCLSGGLDSGSIVSLASRMRPDPMDTFSSVYPQADCDESLFIRAIAGRCGSHAHEVQPDPAGLPDLFPRMMWHQDEPSAAPGIYSQWKVMEAARGHVTVLLDGQGGDEILAGYHSYFPEHLTSLASRIASGGEDESRLWEEVRLIEALTGRSHTQDAHRALRRARRPRWLARLGANRPGRIKPPHYLTAEFASAAMEGRAVRDWLGRTRGMARSRPPRTFDDRLLQRLYNDLTLHSIPSLLRYEDRNSMAFSLESRTPFLDYRLVEFCFSLPARFKISGAETKLVLRRAMSGLMPREVVERRDKLGFPTPVSHWFRNELKDWVESVFRDSRFKNRGILQPSEVEEVLRRHAAGEDRSWDLWRFLSAEIWARQFLDGDGFSA